MAKDLHGNRTEQCFSMKQIRIMGFCNNIFKMNCVKFTHNVFIQVFSVSSSAAILGITERANKRRYKKF